MTTLLVVLLAGIASADLLEEVEDALTETACADGPLKEDLCAAELRWIAHFDSPEQANDGSYDIVVRPQGDLLFITGIMNNDPGELATIAYNTTDGSEVWAARYEGPGGGYDRALAMAVSPDGERVYVTGQSGTQPSSLNSVYVTTAYDAVTGAELWADLYDGGHGGSQVAQDVAVSPDGTKIFVTGYSNSPGFRRDIATLSYDAFTGDRLWTHRYDAPESGTTDSGYGLTVSPDGARVYVTGQSLSSDTGSRFVTIAYDTTDGEALWTSFHQGPDGVVSNGRVIDIDPEGTRVYVSGPSMGDGSGVDFATIAYDAEDGTELWVERYDHLGFYDRPNAMQVAIDGTALYLTGQGSVDQGFGFEYVTVSYNTTDGTRNWASAYNGAPWNVQDVDSQIPCQPALGVCGIANPDTGEALGLSPDGSTVFVSGGSLRHNEDSSDMVTVSYRASDGQERWVARHNGEAGGSERALGLAVHPDGSSVYVTGGGAGDGSWDMVTLSYDADPLTGFQMPTDLIPEL